VCGTDDTTQSSHMCPESNQTLGLLGLAPTMFADAAERDRDPRAVR
jgi:hypothetical protein